MLDIRLPGLDGYEVARPVRATSWGERIPVIALSGFGTAEDRDQALGSGFEVHVTKSGDFADLLLLVDRWAAAPEALGLALAPADERQ